MGIFVARNYAMECVMLFKSYLLLLKNNISSYLKSENIL